MTLQEKKKKLLNSFEKCLTVSERYDNIILEETKVFKTNGYEIKISKGTVVPDADEDFIARYFKLMDIMDKAYSAKVINLKELEKIIKRFYKEVG